MLEILKSIYTNIKIAYLEYAIECNQKQIIDAAIKIKFKRDKLTVLRNLDDIEKIMGERK